MLYDYKRHIISLQGDNLAPVMLMNSNSGVLPAITNVGMTLAKRPDGKNIFQYNENLPRSIKIAKFGAIISPMQN